MRSFAVLALCLGLFAVAQALDETEGVLLKGLIADADMYKDGNVSILNGWHHRHGHRHHHDPEDHEYWHRRHSVKSELLHCLKIAHDDCDLTDAASLKRAGRRIAHCLLDHLGGCHDVPGIGGDITNTIPYYMAVAGFDALIAAGPTGLDHAFMVFSFYLAGAPQKVIDPAGNPIDNPWFVSNGCAGKLVALLTSGCQGAGMQQIWALAEVVAKFIEKIYTSTDADLGLGDCVADIPAVLVSLFSTSCPKHGVTENSYLYNPLTGATSPCRYVAANDYENSPGALLGGSIYSLLLLSSDARLRAIGFQLGFAAVRMALAATQTTEFVPCLGNPSTGGGQLSIALTSRPTSGTPPLFTSGVPLYSGVVPLSPPAYTPRTLGADGQRVICASIAMMSGKQSTEVDAGRTYEWNRNLMWQGSADIVNAIAKTVVAKQSATTLAQKKGLCLLTKAIYTFSTLATPGVTPAERAVVAVPPYGIPITPFEYDWSCSTDGDTCDLVNTPPAWLTGAPNFFVNKPVLVAGHNLGTGSPYDISCKDLIFP